MRRPPAPDIQLLFQSESVRVLRQASVPAQIVYKEPRGANAAKRLRREAEILTRLRGVPNVSRQAVEWADTAGCHRTGRPGSDHACKSLAGRPAPSWKLFLGMACSLARTLAAVHRAGGDPSRHLPREHHAGRGARAGPHRLRSRRRGRRHAFGRRRRVRRDTALRSSGANRANRPAGRPPGGPLRFRGDALRSPGRTGAFRLERSA